MEFKTILRKLMTEASLSAKKLSVATGVSEGTIKTYLAGSHPRNMNDVRKIAKYFGVSLEYLFWGEESEYVPKSLEEIPLEEVYNGWIKVRIERAVKLSNKKDS